MALFHHSPAHHSPAARRRLLVLPTAAVLAVGALTGSLTSGPSASAADIGPITAEAPLYAVTQEGLTPEQAESLAGRLGIQDGLREDGSFSYVDSTRAGAVPQVRGKRGRDEDGRRTLRQKLDLEALKARRAYPEDRALEISREVLPLPEGFEATPRVTHTTLELGRRRGGVVGSFDLDTGVSYDLSLRGVPVVGPASRSRVTFGDDGSVIALNQATRSVTPAGFVGIVGPDVALQECVRLYGEQVKQADPTLVYYSPALTGQGEGTVKYLVPHYACQPVTGDEQADAGYGRLVPAAPELTPAVTVAGTRKGRAVSAELKIDGGQAPYSIAWSSSSNLVTKGEEAVSFRIGGRQPGAPQRLTATITDANGLTAAATVVLTKAGGSDEATGVGGAGGTLGSVGIEQTVDEWQCAQDSAIGFKDVMNAHAQSVKFDWRGTNAWESDFKRTSAGGHDGDWVDSVDAQWYTGHGSPDSFTFKNTTHDDRDLTPSDARWGDNFNLEWMQLESCQVLRDTNGTNDYFQRWAPAFDGLHLLNGFHTNAQCVGGGTGRRFAEYLFPGFFWRPSLTVAQAWQSMADDLEPGGTVWRSISPAGAGWLNNLGDHYWGQGSVGPDIPLSQQIGWVAISGTV